MRLEEYSLSFGNVRRCEHTEASLAMRERVFLYGLVYSLGPSWVLEIGTFKGGSAYVISGALDDVALGGRLVTIDPRPEQIAIDWSAIAHNSKSVKGLFPNDIEKVKLANGAGYDLVFVDGDHSYNAVLEDLRHVRQLMSSDAYVLLHDAYNEDVSRAIQESVRNSWYRDCGTIGRVVNDTCGDQLYGGFHLLSAG